MPTLKELCTSYLKNKQLVEALEKEQRDTRAAIIKHLSDKEVRDMVEDGFDIKLIAKTRKSISAQLIKENLGVEVTDDCYKATGYDELHVKMLVA